MADVDILTNDAAKYRINNINKHEQRLVKLYAMMVYSDVASATTYVANPGAVITDAAAALKGADEGSISAGKTNVWIQAAVSVNGAAKTNPNDILPLVKVLMAKSDQELDAIEAFLLMKVFVL